MHGLRFRVLRKTKRRKPLILMGFQRFIPSDIFDYFALMSGFSKSLENRLPKRHGGSNTAFGGIWRIAWEYHPIGTAT